MCYIVGMKRWGIFIAVIIVAVLFWLYANRWVQSDSLFKDIDGWLIPLGLLVLLNCFLGLAYYLIDGKAPRLLLSTLVALIAVGVFGYHWLLLIGVALVVLFHLRAIYIVGQESRERIKVNISAVLRRSLPMLLMPILIMISFAYFNTPKVQESAQKKQLPEGFTRLVDQTITLFFESEIRQYPEVEQDRLRKEFTEQIVERFTQQTSPYFRFLPPVLAFGLFLLLQGLSFIFMWLSIWLGRIIFRLLKILGFIEMERTQLEVERIKKI